MELIPKTNITINELIESIKNKTYKEKFNSNDNITNFIFSKLEVLISLDGIQHYILNLNNNLFYISFSSSFLVDDYIKDIIEITNAEFIECLPIFSIKLSNNTNIGNFTYASLKRKNIIKDNK